MAPAFAPAPHKRSHARVWVVVLTVIALALGGLAAYLWSINGQWQDQNEALRTDVADLTTQIDDTNVQIMAVKSDLADAQANLEGATGKVTDLADRSANAKDQSAFLAELVDSFEQCALAQANHIIHLQDASRYTPSSLAAEGRDVANYCDSVEQSYADYLASPEAG